MSKKILDVQNVTLNDQPLEVLSVELTIRDLKERMPRVKSVECLKPFTVKGTIKWVDTPTYIDSSGVERPTALKHLESD